MNLEKLIKVKVLPGSKKEEIIKKSEDSFEVKVKEKPERGLANRKVIKVLSAYFKIPESKIRLVKGFKERNKIFKIIKNNQNLGWWYERFLKQKVLEFAKKHKISILTPKEFPEKKKLKIKHGERN